MELITITVSLIGPNKRPANEDGNDARAEDEQRARLLFNTNLDLAISETKQGLPDGFTIDLYGGDMP